MGRKRVARLMRGAQRRRTAGNEPKDPGKRLPVFEDRVERNFTAAASDQLWVGDLTQHRTVQGWVYVAGVLDMFNRRLVGWSMGESMSAELVVNAVSMVIKNRSPGPGLFHHSDRGSQGSLIFGQALEASGIVGSMGRKGDAYDNAAMESFWATLQTELLDRYEWKTLAELRTPVVHFIEVFYNRKRLHSSLGYLSPEAFNARYYEEQAPT